ncbi:hypothetical protein [Aureimonas glaciei]|uniref:Uncharacterized protein n=1 Tax=Aureimonas glaciei TaxID=1776957 RepID=A0A916XVX8_9HYPH|nr:hypothetical protein [Aureimonas glaciei]GGD15481.1 hypothetical protein GCM10011335_17880 [Aureimonas glaciei]
MPYTWGRRPREKPLSPLGDGRRISRSDGNRADIAANPFGSDADGLLSYRDATTTRFAAFDGEALEGAL